MKKFFLAMLMSLAMVSPLLAGGTGITRQNYTAYDGTYLGRSYTNPYGQSRYYNSYGQRSGYSYQYGPYTRYYGQSNAYLGDTLNRGNGVNVVRPYGSIR